MCDTGRITAATLPGSNTERGDGHCFRATIETPFTARHGRITAVSGQANATNLTTAQSSESNI